MQKNVLISVGVLNDIADLLLALRHDEAKEHIIELAERIENALIEKLERSERREAFSRYKVALSDDERETAYRVYSEKKKS